MSNINLFGQNINIRPYICSPEGGINCTNTKINFYIYASGNCPAHCSFCPGFSSKNKTDLNKLKLSLNELHNKKLINRIGITGGEPLSNINNLNQILQVIYDVCKTQYHISINTNGINLNLLRKIDYYSIINDVHISRHSENDDENNKIFGITTCYYKEIKKEVELGPKIFSLSCNLINGYIDSVKRIKSYLDQAIDIGAVHVGFVSLMPKTNICSDLFVDFESLTSKFRIQDGFLYDACYKDKDCCQCKNFDYYNDNGNVSLYLRKIIKNNQEYAKCFIFNQDNELTINFGKGMVII